MSAESFKYCNSCKNKKECFENNWCVTMDRGRKIDGILICDNYKEDMSNNKPVNNILRYVVVFFEEPPKANTFGSNDISYEIYYDTKTGIMQVVEIGAFGDGRLVARYQDKRNRGITIDEMLENIKEISNMTYKEFKQKILKER